MARVSPQEAQHLIVNVIRPGIFESKITATMASQPQAIPASVWQREARTSVALVNVIESAKAEMDVRKVLASEGLFELLLTHEQDTALNVAVNAYTSNYGTIPSSNRAAWVAVQTIMNEVAPDLVSRSRKPFRLQLLEAIRAARVGSVFGGADTTGVASWIQSVSGSMAAAVRTLERDQEPTGLYRQPDGTFAGGTFLVASALLRIIIELTIPEGWAREGTPLPGASAQPSRLYQAVQTFITGIERSPDLLGPDRVRFAGFADQAKSRLTGLMAAGGPGATTNPFKFGGGSAGPSSVTLPDGTTIPTAPGKPRPWYQDGRLWAVGAFGVILGAGVHARK